MGQNDLVVSWKIHANETHSGMDTLEQCRDPDHFKNYAWPVHYEYNSRGYRDAEWPQDLQSAVWCVGDSFTVGIGQPLDHTWPQILSDRIKRRTINISQDGAANALIADRVRTIIGTVNPEHMVIMWSYLHRRWAPGFHMPNQHFTKTTDQEDVEDFAHWVHDVELHKGRTRIVHSVVPLFCPGEFQDLAMSVLAPYLHVPHTRKLDLARDGHHFDRVTAEWVVERVVPLLGL